MIMNHLLQSGTLSNRVPWKIQWSEILSWVEKAISGPTDFHPSSLHDQVFHGKKETVLHNFRFLG